MARVSVIIPSRNERFLCATVHDLLAKAAGDVEIVVVCDGYYEHGLPSDTRVKVLHFGRAQGMRPAINAATQIATGDYFLKSDGHCLFDEGWDTKLTADYLEDNWILTPRRFALDAENWRIDESRPDKYPIDYEYLSYGLERPDDPTCGFHGTPWAERKKTRADVLLDTDMSSQGSVWFMSKKHWQRQIVALDIARFGSFFGESQEIGLRTQLAGGAMMRTKNTWYAHWRKSKAGRGYVLGPNGHKNGAREIVRLCMLDLWPGQVRSLKSLVEEFWPVPTWPADLDRCFAEARQKFAVAA